MNIKISKKEISYRHETIYFKYKKEFDIFDDIQKLRKTMMKNSPIFSQSISFKTVLWALMGKVSKTLKAVGILCNHGYGEDATILLRSVFEAVVYVVYMYNGDKEKLALRYIKYDKVIKKIRFSQMQKSDKAHSQHNEPSAEENKILNDYKNFLEEYGDKTRSTQSIFGRNLKDISADINFKEHYETFYPFASSFVHSLPDFTYSMIGIDENKDKRFFLGQTTNLILPSLRYASYFLLKMLDIIDEEFSMNFSEQIQEVKNKFNQCYTK